MMTFYLFFEFPTGVVTLYKGDLRSRFRGLAASRYRIDHLSFTFGLPAFSNGCFGKANICVIVLPENSPRDISIETFFIRHFYFSFISIFISCYFFIPHISDLPPSMLLVARRVMRRHPLSQ